MGFGVVLPVARRQAEAALLSTNLSDAVPLAVAGDSETPASSCLTFRIVRGMREGPRCRLPKFPQRIENHAAFRLR